MFYELAITTTILLYEYQLNMLVITQLHVYKAFLTWYTPTEKCANNYMQFFHFLLSCFTFNICLWYSFTFPWDMKCIASRVRMTIQVRIWYDILYCNFINQAAAASCSWLSMNAVFKFLRKQPNLNRTFADDIWPSWYFIGDILILNGILVNNAVP